MMDVLERLELRGGSMRDYESLSRFHYRGRRPATVWRVWAMEDAGGGLIDARARVVGVLVESMPVLSCKSRDGVLGGRYGAMSVAERARWVNQHLRCISRVIVHPRWRGLGVGVRLVRQALSTATTRYTEALAAMGHVHPLFAKAGMRACDKPEGRPVYYLWEREEAEFQVSGFGVSS